MTQLYIICFDIHDERRLRKVSKQMENFGQRVQYSVFECYLDKADLKELKQRLIEIIDDSEDHIRYYSLCGKDKNKIIVDGRGDGEITPENDYHLL